jgi:flagellar biosynthesis protein FliQ
MEPSTISYEIYTALMAGLVIAGPIMAVAAGAGLLLGILQAATQIQDQALPQIVKIFIVSFTLILFGGVLAVPLFNQASRILDTFPVLVR